MSKFLVWAKSKSDPQALWFTLPQAPMYRDQAEHLIDVYTENWGNQYTYEIHLCGFQPKGTSYPDQVPA